VIGGKRRPASAGEIDDCWTDMKKDFIDMISEVMWKPVKGVRREFGRLMKGSYASKRERLRWREVVAVSNKIWGE
jgi:hypothetical protein